MYNFQSALIAVQSTDGTLRTIYNGEPGITPGYVNGPSTTSSQNASVPADSNGMKFYVTDQLGTTQMDSPQPAYRSGGRIHPLWAGNRHTTTQNRFKFTGKERDTESGLDYFGARYMSSNMGRFMSPDFNDIPDSVPYADFDNPQSLNLYCYVRNNLLSSVDPDGHDRVVQSRVDDNLESVSVSSGNCDGVKLGSGQSATYVAGTVTGITADGGNSIDIGHDSYDGQSSGVTNSRGAPGFDHPGIDGPANAAIFGQIGNGGMAAIKHFTIGSASGRDWRTWPLCHGNRGWPDDSGR